MNLVAVFFESNSFGGVTRFASLLMLMVQRLRSQVNIRIVIKT